MTRSQKNINKLFWIWSAGDNNVKKEQWWCAKNISLSKITYAMVVSKMRLDENLREIQGLRLIPASWLRRFQNVAALPDCLLVYVEPSKWFTLFSLLPLIRQYVTYTYCRLQVVWAWNWRTWGTDVLSINSL